MTATTLKERGIIFSAEMVRAILDGRKTQTRRLVKPQPYYSRSNPPSFSDTEPGDLFICPDLFPTSENRGWVITRCENHGTYHSMGQQEFGQKHCPYGPVGRRLWVREAWGYVGGDEYIYMQERGAVRYHSDFIGNESVPGGRWRSPIHMPRFASRMTLEVTGIRCERVQDISETDADAEGTTSHYYCEEPTATRDGVHRCQPIEAYRRVWESLHTTPGTRWEDNPWVWVIDFKKLEASQ